MYRLPPLALAIGILLALVHPAFALIEGSAGNKPIDDPGWPAGAAIVFNQSGRIAYWVGPPFGGGQWHAECRGDANALNFVLANFAKIDAKVKRVVVHDGVGRSFWLNPNNEALKVAASQIDWAFMVWQKENWKQSLKLPPSLRPGEIGDVKMGPPTQIDVYVGGDVRWADVVVPQGIEVVDERLSAHGATAADGTVLEGTIIDLETKKPLAGHAEVQLIQPKKEGSCSYTTLAQTNADDQGKWRLKNAPAGSIRIVLLATGYVPRIMGYGRYDSESGWHSFNGALLRSGTASGRVTDSSGKPLPDVVVRLFDIASHNEAYATAGEFRTKTDADGRFHFDEVPIAAARIGVSKDGYCLPGLGPEIKVPAKEVAIVMPLSAEVQVTVDFANTERPQKYLVEIEPEGGNVVGSWGGGSHIDQENQVTFKNIPPGQYFLWGHPNPHSEKLLPKRIALDLKGGAHEEIVLPAQSDR